MYLMLYTFRCWLPPDDGLIWSFLGPAIVICIVNYDACCFFISLMQNLFVLDQYSSVC